MKRWTVVVIAALVSVLALGAGAVALNISGGADGPGQVFARGMHVAKGMPGGMNGMHGMHGMRGSRVTTERAWLTEMVAHHREAVEAAGELARSDRRQMRDLGEAIVHEQSEQIELMEGWLEEWYGGPAAGVRYRPMMRDLTGLSGDRLDRVFLQDMVRHHMMAVMASQQLLVRDLAEHPQVAALAEDIRDSQHREIFRMQQWLADWFGVRGGHGMGAGPAHGMGPGMMSRS